jgi:hypothetical protein
VSGRILPVALMWAESGGGGPHYRAARNFGLLQFCRVGRWDLSLTLVNGAFGNIRQKRSSNCGGAEMRLGDSVGRV